MKKTTRELLESLLKIPISKKDKDIPKLPKAHPHFYLFVCSNSECNNQRYYPDNQQRSCDWCNQPYQPPRGPFNN